MINKKILDKHFLFRTVVSGTDPLIFDSPCFAVSPLPSTEMYGQHGAPQVAESRPPEVDLLGFNDDDASIGNYSQGPGFYGLNGFEPAHQAQQAYPPQQQQYAAPLASTSYSQQGYPRPQQFPPQQQGYAQQPQQQNPPQGMPSQYQQQHY